MDVVVDGESNFRVEGEPEDALAVLGAVSEFLRGQQRAILTLRVDDRELSPEDVVTTLQDTPLSAVQRIEVTSGHVADLVSRVVTEMADVLPELSAACHGLAEIFHGDQPEEGYEPFTHLAEIWQDVKTQQIQMASLIGIDGDTLQIDGKSFEALHEELNVHLKEAVEALEANDCILLGDLLEYELAPRAEQETAIVELLKAQAQQ